MKYVCTLLFFLLSFSLFAATQPLSADQAFQFSATAKDDQTLLLRWQMPPSYYLYTDKFLFKTTDSSSAQLGEPLYPSDVKSLKTPLGMVSVYANTLVIPIPILHTTQKTLLLQVSYQGCSQQGYCYSPESKVVSINLAGQYMQWVHGYVLDLAPTVTTPTVHTNFWLSILGFFGVGVLLSLTPCILPMIPILSGIIVGQKNRAHTHSFLLSVFYVVGAATAYATVGVLFALLGKNIQLALQSRWILIAVTLLLILMALSLLDFFQLRLPATWQRCLLRESSHQKSGTYAGVFVMGLLSALILSPCVTPPLVAALAYISHTGNLLLGGVSLFAMGLGAGLPLLVIGALGPKMLPKPGHWMVVIKYLMAAALLVVAGMVLDRALSHGAEQTLPLPFQAVQRVAQVENILKKSGEKIVLLDFYADWCAACKAMDKNTFRDPEVQKILKSMILLRADITRSTADTQALLQHYQVIAPPTLLLFQHQKALTVSPIVGYQSPEKLLVKIIGDSNE